MKTMTYRLHILFLVLTLLVVAAACGDSASSEDPNDVVTEEMDESMDTSDELSEESADSGFLEVVPSGDPATPNFTAATALQAEPLVGYLGDTRLTAIALSYRNDTNDQFRIIVSGQDAEAVNRYINATLLTFDADSVYFQPELIPVEPTLPLGEMLLEQLAESTGIPLEEMADLYDALVEENGADSVSISLMAEVLGLDTLELASATHTRAINHYLSGPNERTDLRAIAAEPGVPFLVRPRRPGDFLLLETIEEFTGYSPLELNEIYAQYLEQGGDPEGSLELFAEELGFTIDDIVAAAEGNAPEFTNREVTFTPKFAADARFIVEPETPLEMYVVGSTLSATDLTLRDLNAEVETGPGRDLTVAQLNANAGISREAVAVDVAQYGFVLPTIDDSVESSIATLLEQPGPPFATAVASQAVLSDPELLAALEANPQNLLITFEWLSPPASLTDEVEPAWFKFDPPINRNVTHYYRAVCQSAASATITTSEGEATLNMWRRTITGWFLGDSQTVSAAAGNTKTLSDSVAPDVIQFDINVRGEEDDSVYEIEGFWTRGFGTDC